MTFATVSQALSQGYAISNVIKSVLRMNTPLAKAIKEALKQGYNEDQIGEYLEKGKTSSYSQKNQMLKGMTEEEKARGIAYHQPKSEKNIGKILQTAAIAAPVAAAGAIAGPAIGAAVGRMAPLAINALQRAAPQLAGPGAIPGGAQALAQTGVLQGSPPAAQAAQTPQTVGSIHQTPQQLPQQPPANQVAASIPEPVNIQQPKVFDTNIIKNGLAYRRQIDSLISSGNGPEEIEAYLKKFNPQFIKTIEKEGKGPFKDIVGQYIQEKLRDEAMQPEGSVPKELEKNQQEIEKPKIEKNSVVSSPQGIGEVKEIRNGQALLEVDGKLHKVNEDELLESPLPEKELADLYDDLLHGIETETGEDVSRMVQWAGYNPDTNTLQFLPHTGKLYKYGNISPEDAALLTDILSVRKTSGENFIGAWKKDSKSPIGAALSKLIRKLQTERGGKGKEYEETHEPIYSAYEPAIEAKKKRKKRK